MRPACTLVENDRVSVDLSPAFVRVNFVALRRRYLVHFICVSGIVSQSTKDEIEIEKYGIFLLQLRLFP